MQIIKHADFMAQSFNKVEIPSVKSIKTLKEDNQDLVGEVLKIIDYNKGKIKVLEEEYDWEIFIDIYASYSIDQILVAFRKYTEKKKLLHGKSPMYI